MNKIEELQKLLQDSKVLSVDRHYLRCGYGSVIYTLRFTYEDKTGVIKSFCMINDEFGNVNIYDKKTTIEGLDYWDEIAQLSNDVYYYLKSNNHNVSDLELSDRGTYIAIKSSSTDVCWNIFKSDLNENTLKQLSNEYGIKSFLLDISRGVQ